MRPFSTLLLISVFLILSVGCLSGPLPEDSSDTPAPPSIPPPSMNDLRFMSFSDVIPPPLDPEFALLTPEIEGLVHLPYQNPVDVVSNDLSVLGHPRRLQIMANILSKYTGSYIEPKRETNTIIYFTIYKTKDEAAADEILNAYRGQWNKRQLNVSGGSFWVWDGYIDEMEGLARPLARDSIFYWNPQGEFAFLNQGILTNFPALSKTGTTLFSVHGETAVGRYFIMMDIKSDVADIQNKTTRMFTVAGKTLFTANITQAATASADSGTNQTTTPGENETPTTETEAQIKESLRKALEDFLAGKISKEDYDQQLERYTAELEALKTNQTNQTNSPHG